MKRTPPHLTRREVIAGSAALTMGLPSRSFSQDRPTLQSRPRLGVNLAGPADWNTELPFVDVFRMARPWVSQRAGAEWGEGPDLDLDEHGWVRQLAKGCWAETLVCTIGGGHYPSGVYTVLYEGVGEFEFKDSAKLRSKSPGRLTIDVDASRGEGFRIQLLKTDPANYVRNIRVLMPGSEDLNRPDMFASPFLERWQGIACLRFMDWMETNDSRIVSWSERPTRQLATYQNVGIPLETMVDLANELRTDPWFCMPHLANDDYIRSFAEFVAEHLAPGLKAWVEFSNEVWNGQFDQHDEAGELGMEMGFGEQPWEAAWHYTAHRSVQIFRIWESVFGGSERLVRVLPSQASSTFVSERVLTFEDAYRHADVLAVAPYIGCVVAPSGDEGPTEPVVERWTVDRVLDYMERRALVTTLTELGRQTEMAQRYGLKLVAYEGGQHMTPILGSENNEKITKLFHAANAHPRMRDIYAAMYRGWADAGGDLFCHYSSIARWNKWGSWGMKQHSDEDPLGAPKYRASIEWAKQCGQAMSLT